MKNARHFAIREILKEERITTQDDLCSILKNKGFNVTQATVSRDIKELQLVKVADGKGYKYGLPNAADIALQKRMKRIFKDAVLSIDNNENMIVIKTLPGSAQAVGSLIDASLAEFILGAVAGDDTIFVALKNSRLLQKVLQEFQGLLL
ncbi:MAG: arginine repressor [Syntrophomonadaceae bacterium]|jgi:transcriptional regulator of arginine metabolism|nr:arginine repressor [Syntrophomonadaceae bacterium]